MNGLPAAGPKPAGKGVAAVSLGNALAYYDLIIFSVMAVQISRAIFPQGDELVALMQTFSLVGVAYLARPIGALVLGRLADRSGRRKALMVAFSLSGIAVVGQAMVPTYEAAGIVAPSLMLFFRLMMSFAIGGEFGSATAMLMEAGGRHRRGAYVAVSQAGQDVGRLLAGIVAALLALWLTEAQLIDWGWRIALLLGASIVPFGLYLRSRLVETLPLASDARSGGAAGIRQGGAQISVVVLLLAAMFVGDGIKYLGIYAQTILDLEPRIAFSSTIVLSVVAIGVSLLGGLAADKWGRKPIILLGLALVTVAALPCFLLLNAMPGMLSLVLATGLLAAGLAFSAAPIVTSLAELIPAHRRATSLSLIMAFAIILVSATGDLLITWLLHITGAPLVPAWAMIAAGLVALVASSFVPETRPEPEQEVDLNPAGTVPV